MAAAAPCPNPHGHALAAAYALGWGLLATQGHPDSGHSCLLQEAVITQKSVLPSCLSQLPRLQPPALPSACVTH